MRILRIIFYRLRSIFFGARLDRDAREELSRHYALEVERHLAAGFSPDAAKRAATLDFGNISQLADATRDARGLAWWDALRSDMQYAFRQIRRQPGFSAASILTVGIAIGATSAIFAVVDTVLLRPLPYPDSGRLYRLYEVNTRGNVGRTRATPLNFFDWRDQSTSFAGMAAHIGSGMTLTGRGDPKFSRGQMVTPNLLDVLQIKPAHGRGFRPEETEAGRHRVAILTHRLWTTYFNGDASVLDQKTTINGEPYLIVGILPEGFSYPSDDYELMLPLITQGTVPGMPPISRNSRYLNVIGRLAPGASEAAARSELTVISERLATSFPDANATVTAGMARMIDDVVGDAGESLVIMLVAVGFVLLIACVNVAGLSIARGHARSRELAVRLAIGASRRRLVQQLATEGFVLVAIGGAIGVALAAWSISALAASLPTTIPRVREIALDPRFLVFGAALTIVCALIAGVFPALQIARRESAGDLAGSRGVVSAGRRAQRSRSVLIVAQVATAVVLLTGAALALRSFQHVRNVNKGFDVSNTVTFGFVVREPRFPDADSIRTFLMRANDAFALIPGITAAGTTTHVPLGDNNLENSFTVDGAPTPAGQDAPIAGVRGVSGRFVQSIGAQIARGRDFQPTDTAGSQPVAIVTADFVRRYVPANDPIGTRIKMGGPNSGDPWRTIVGVIDEIRHQALDQAPRPEVWLPFAQLPDNLITTWLRGVNVTARSNGDPMAAVPALRKAINQLDRDLPLINVQSMEALAGESTAVRRLETSLLAAFGTIALGLSAIGLFGLLAFYVAQRIPEFGVRLALGATPATLLTTVLRRGLILLGIGLAVGLPGAFFLGRGMSTILFEVKPSDPIAVLAAVGTLTVVTLAACALPARRAMKVDPLTALRE